MKSVCLQYLEALAQLLAQRKQKPFLRTVHLTFCPDEEIGGPVPACLSLSQSTYLPLFFALWCGQFILFFLSSKITLCLSFSTRVHPVDRS